jgi:hypothetical protein
MSKSTDSENNSVISNVENLESNVDREIKIAECAFYKAEKRGFEPGHELEDWLEAEQECLPNS